MGDSFNDQFAEFVAQLDTDFGVTGGIYFMTLHQLSCLPDYGEDQATAVDHLTSRVDAVDDVFFLPEGAVVGMMPAWNGLLGEDFLDKLEVARGV